MKSDPHADHLHHREGKPGTAAGDDAAAPAGTVYTCPMHPQIRQAGPGSCPICGMALEPVMPSLDEAESPELADFRRRFWWTLPLSIAVFSVAMFGHLLFPMGLPHREHARIRAE